jgi:hypothetical protein
MREAMAGPIVAKPSPKARRTARSRPLRLLEPHDSGIQSELRHESRKRKMFHNAREAQDIVEPRTQEYNNCRLTSSLA